MNTHLTAELVAAYLDRGMSAVERETVEAHLADCGACRQELVEVARLRRASPQWRRWYVLAPAAAAAAVLILAVGRGGGPGGTEVTRTGTSPGESIPRFTALAPGPTAPVAPDSVVFAWRSAGPDGTYRLVVSGPAGEGIWSHTTADTTAALPATVGLARGTSYFWYADALLPDGRTATTGMQQFSTRP